MASLQERIDEVKAKRGYLLPFHVFLLKHDPEFFDRYNALVEKALLLDDAQAASTELPAKYRELVVSAILAYRGSTDGLRAHVRRALKLGSTPKEIVEAFEAAMIPGGAPTLLAGCEALDAVLDEMGGESAENRD